MRIVVDMQGAQSESRLRGIGRYSLAIAQALVRNRGEHEVILALNGLFPDTIEPIRATFDEWLPQDNIRVWQTPGPVRECDPGNEWRRDVAERIREAFLAALKPDVVLLTSLFEGYLDDAVTSIGALSLTTPTAVILYDLIPLLNPDTYLRPNPRYAEHYRRKVEAFERANVWLAISTAAAQEARDALSLPQDRVANISAACDAMFGPQTIPELERAALLSRFGIDRPFVMYSGGADSRKNLRRLVSAYGRLPKRIRKGHQLVMVGHMPEVSVADLTRIARASGLAEDEVRFTGYVSDAEVIKLYNLCQVLVLPSLHEGFGLTALEAMSCGAAVLGANATSIPEVIGRADALFDPRDEDQMARVMANVLDSEQLRGELQRYGLDRAKAFSWDASARAALDAIERVCDPASRDTRTGPVEDEWADMRQLIRGIAGALPGDTPESALCELAQCLARIRDDTSHKQLLVDISELVHGDAATGIQRVTRSVLWQLLQSPPDGFVVEPVYASTEAPGYRYARRFAARMQGREIVGDDATVEYRAGDVFLGLDLQHHTTRAQAAHLAQMRRDGVLVYFVVYDLLPITFPHYWPSESAFDVLHHEWLRVVTQADGAVCISRAVADDLSAWLRRHGTPRLRAFKTGWFHLGADLQSSVPSKGLPPDAEELLTQLSRRPTFLTVGTLEPRKAYAQVLSAFDLLWRSGIDANLLIIGKQGWLVEELAARLRGHEELGARLLWLQGISDEYLERIYAVSTCLIAASEGEGFGLPLIEAAQHNCPIIARDIPVFREVAGDFAFYFDGRDSESLAGAIHEWLRLFARSEHPRSHGMPWLTWTQSTQQLLAAVLGGPTPQDLLLGKH